MPDNYLKMRQSAQALFMEYDQEAIISRWSLRHDDDWLYVRYMGQALKISRRNASLAHAEALAEGEFDGGNFINESMVLFDVLTCSPIRPRPTGQWCSVGTLGGIIGAGHDRTLSNHPFAARFSGRTGALARACEKLGGVREGKADAGYVIPVFEDFAILFQFWDADDEFPAVIKYLFDANALKYMHYETLWYAMNTLERRLAFYFDQYK